MTDLPAEALHAQIPAPILVEIAQGQRQMAQHVELPPLCHGLHLAQIVGPDGGI